METIAGIDLGTTNSEIAVVIDGKLEVVPIDGDPIMPSAVGIDAAGELLVGRPARNQMVSDPESTVLSVKRLMGQETRLQLRNKSFSPEEISSFILRELKMHAERRVGSAIAKAVITVPAYFSDRQRAATRDAGVLAGLDVVRIINEPTAAALAYEADHGQNQNILVYDLGGGTFDVSLVVVEDGVVEVKSSHGDTHLGGDDFDALLIDHVVNRIRKDSHESAELDLKGKRRLWKAVERAKRELSDAPFAHIREEYVIGNAHADIEIARQEYEAMIAPLLRKTLDCIHKCLKDASFLPGAINKVLLVGGATRTPLVREMIEREMGLVPRHEINPDLIVAMGAGLQGSSIAGNKARSILVDITPYSFGLVTAGEHNGEFSLGTCHPIIKRGTALPVRKSEVFCTMVDDQPAAEITVFQGEAPLSEGNIIVGEFLVSGLSDAPAGNPIVANLELDLNGMLKVTAVEKATGLAKTVIMDTRDTSKNFNLEAARLNMASLLGDGELAGSAAGDVVADVEETDKNASLSRAKQLRTRAEKILGKANAEDGAEINGLLQKSAQAIAAGAWGELDECNGSLGDILFYLED